MNRPKHVVVETSYVKTPYQYKHYKLCLILTLPIFVYRLYCAASSGNLLETFRDNLNVCHPRCVRSM